LSLAGPWLCRWRVGGGADRPNASYAGAEFINKNNLTL
jgi:hypothetical protein